MRQYWAFNMKKSKPESKKSRSFYFCLAERPTFFYALLHKIKRESEKNYKPNKTTSFFTYDYLFFVN